MRALAFLPLFLLASCGSSSSPPFAIGPDHDDGGVLADAEPPDGAVPVDGALPDGGTPKPGDVSDGSRLKAVYISGDDGSRAALPGVWRDTQLDVECAFSTAADGRLRCLPQNSASVPAEWFSDSACSRPVAYLSWASCHGEPRYAWAAAGGSAACASYRVLQLAGRYTGQVYAKSGSTCFALGPSSDTSYFLVGAEVPATSFVAGSRK